MNALMGLLILVSLAGIVVGLVMCMIPRQRSRGKNVAFYGAAGFLCAFTFIVLGPKQETSTTAADVSTSLTQPQQSVLAPAKLSYSEVLARLKVDSVTWEKAGFGSIMVASFVIRNNSPIDVKDITVKCRHSGNSGTYIDSNTRTVYEVVPHNSYQAVINLNMGFIHSAVSRTTCAVHDYAPV